MIAIIGAGISGLTLAYRLQQAGKPYRIYTGSQTGGLLQSQTHSGPNGSYLLELGPNSLMADARTEAFLAELGLTNAVQQANPVSENRYILRRGKVSILPAKPLALLTGSFFSTGAKLKIVSEFFNKTRSRPGETLADFFRRRFGKEVTDYALDPFISGIFAGDIEKLLVSETFPSLVETEATYGSVLKGLSKQVRSRRKIVSFKGGLAVLGNTLAASLHNKTAAEVSRIERAAGAYRIIYTLSNGAEMVQQADKVVLALPADRAAALLGAIMPVFAAAVAALYYPPMAMVHTAFNKADVKHPLNGFGCLHPHMEQTFTAGSIWSSSVFEGRCPPDQVLLTTFIGGAVSGANALLPLPEIEQRTLAELSEIYGISGPPVMLHSALWPQAIPQYTAEVLPVKAAALAAEVHGLYVCANWLGGVSLPDCMRKADALAERL